MNLKIFAFKNELFEFFPVFTQSYLRQRRLAIEVTTHAY